MKWSEKLVEVRELRSKFKLSTDDLDVLVQAGMVEPKYEWIVGKNGEPVKGTKQLYRVCGLETPEDRERVLRHARAIVGLKSIDESDKPSSRWKTTENVVVPANAAYVSVQAVNEGDGRTMSITMHVEPRLGSFVVPAGTVFSAD